MAKNKWSVGIREVHVRTVEVEADNAQDAMERASSMDMDNVDEIMTEFSHTMDWDNWTVALIEGEVKCTHPDHVDSVNCLERAVGCSAWCGCCLENPFKRMT